MEVVEWRWGPQGTGALSGLFLRQLSFRKQFVETQDLLEFPGWSVLRPACVPHIAVLGAG